MLCNQVHPVIQTLFPNNSAVYQDDDSESVLSWSEEREGEYFPWLASTITSEYH
jgi:hypothetical protein